MYVYITILASNHIHLHPCMKITVITWTLSFVLAVEQYEFFVFYGSQVRIDKYN